MKTTQTSRHSLLTLTQNLEDYFAEECWSIAHKQGLKLSEALSRYLGELLARFVQADRYLCASQDPFAVKPRKEFPSVVQLWLEAHTRSQFEQLLQLQHVGDIALFTSGFFPERIDRSLVDMDFYTAVGGQAYQRAGQIRESLASERMMNIYFELASRFHELKEVLAELSDQQLLASEKDRLKLYEKWLSERSPRIKRMLAEVGIIAEGKGDNDRFYPGS
jgi:hypothetical protein